ncbi:hypothetical protein BD410DRAFT_808217 [Rickenella mellea]|uniref:DUF4238 domain-containing protein n=1 Tax=Rickenella mellea TaxID=50990 RepID=A0A4Y7PMF9_9AGAM|nr:hypothetical protein BD410DRAFT_808217 [Rickenella mellea]
METTAGPQYHNYIPRFVLHRWKVESDDSNEASVPRTVRKKRKKQRKRGIPKESINVYDVQQDELSLRSTDFCQIYGDVDMYKDPDNSEGVYHIEKAFSKLENEACQVIRKLEKAHSDGALHVVFRREELDTLRKFLFILNYRNSSRSRQFINGDFTELTRVEVDAFKEKHKLKDHRAVWLFNIKHLISTPHWEVSEDDRILVFDRMDYDYEMKQRQIGFYQVPRDDPWDSEFLLTENSFGLWEGVIIPSTSSVNPMLGGGSNYCFQMTRIYPITPNIVVILRDSILSLQDHFFMQILPILPILPESYFANFPRSWATVMYDPRPLIDPREVVRKPAFQRTAAERRAVEDLQIRGMIGGRVVYTRSKDLLDFQIHPLTSSQTGKVNTMILINCEEKITFKSASALYHSILHYEKDDYLNPVQGLEHRTRFRSLKRRLLEAEVVVNPLRFDYTNDVEFSTWKGRVLAIMFAAFLIAVVAIGRRSCFGEMLESLWSLFTPAIVMAIKIAAIIIPICVKMLTLSPLSSCLMQFKEVDHAYILAVSFLTKIFALALCSLLSPVGVVRELLIEIHLTVSAIFIAVSFAT